MEVVSLERKDLVKNDRVIEPAIILQMDGTAITDPTKKFIVSEDNRIREVVSTKTVVVTDSIAWDWTIKALEEADMEFIVDSHISVSRQTFMIVLAVFPQITIWDGESNVSPALWVHNGSNKQLSFGYFLGLYRWINHTASALYTPPLDKVYHKSVFTHLSIDIPTHTPLMVKEGMKVFADIVAPRINALRQVAPSPSFINAITDYLGKSVATHLKKNFLFEAFWERVQKEKSIKTAYDLYKVSIEFISYHLHPMYRNSYYRFISKAFEL